MIGAEQRSRTACWLALFGADEPQAIGAAGPNTDRSAELRWSDQSGRLRSLHLVGDSPDVRSRMAEAAGCQVMFDGILYNAAQIAGSLVNAGGAPVSDAEALLRGYLRWGEAVLQRVKGIFCLIIWDSRRESL